MDSFGIYVHIPFCVSKCNYCNFVSMHACDDLQSRYVNFLCEEIAGASDKFKEKICFSIYFGGGTPSIIDDELIEKILKTIKNNYKISKNAEISIECNPCTASDNKLKNYLKFGINRISFGVQSFNDDELKLLGRRHDSMTAKMAIQTAQNVGFKNISIDLMIGIPNQTQKSLISTINEAIAQNVNHISAYMLMLEEGTPLYNMIKSKKISVASDDACVDMYNVLYKKLSAFGFERYEISNFAIAGYECEHNQNYWNLGEYIGFGVSAHSYVDGVRFSNSNDIDKYLNGQDKTFEVLSDKEKIEETIMLGLRCKNGVSIKKLKELGYDILNEKADEIKYLLDGKFIAISGENIKITEKNFGMSSAIILRLI